MTASQITHSAPQPPEESEVFLHGKRLLRFEALQQALVPRAARFNEEERLESRRLVNTLVGGMPPANQRKLGLFFLIIDVLSFFFGFRSFRNLSPSRRNKLLAWLFDNPVGLLRKGFWGLNTVARIGVYGQPSLYEEIGYQVRENP